MIQTDTPLIKDQDTIKTVNTYLVHEIVLPQANIYIDKGLSHNTPLIVTLAIGLIVLHWLIVTLGLIVMSMVQLIRSARKMS